MNTSYQICSKTIMDNTVDNEITFDENGISNYVYEYNNLVEIRIPPDDKKSKKLQEVIDAIKQNSVGKDYDCLIGVSGGVDSTYLAYKLKEMGLRSLAVHVDNGWNSELAVDNIQRVLNKLDIDLYTNVLNWEEFKDLQLSFLKASTPDGEIPTDHAITATLYHIAAKFNIKYIISGTNVRTEGIMPRTWSDGHLDWVYIKNIQKKFGSKKLTSYTHLSLWDYINYILIKRIKKVSILDFIEYDKKEALKLLKEELGWREYGGKHYESIYTRFFQGYILPTKFKIDKRRGHLSTLICSGQLSRQEALDEIRLDPYPSEEMKRQDKEYALKKLGISEETFNEIMQKPNKRYSDYKNNSTVLNALWKYYDIIRKFNTQK